MGQLLISAGGLRQAAGEAAHTVLELLDAVGGLLRLAAQSIDVRILPGFVGALFFVGAEKLGGSGKRRQQERRGQERRSKALDHHGQPDSQRGLQFIEPV